MIFSIFRILLASNNMAIDVQNVRGVQGAFLG